jgi:hydrogenase-4 component F
VGAVLVAIALGGLVAGAACWWSGARLAKVLSAVASVGTFALALSLVPAVAAHGKVTVGGLFRVDPLALVFLLAASFVYAASTIFSLGYLGPVKGAGAVAEEEGASVHVAPGAAASRRYSSRFFAGLNLFGWAMAVAVMADNLALLWVAIEVTTIVSALLVAIDGTDEAAEASWKYVLLASLGLGIALFATILVYDAGSAVFGPVYSLSYTKLLTGAAHFPATVVRLSYVLAVLGFGTKMGLFPVHTWLPDAHSEAPTPVSAMLSGALLAVCFYAILRYFQIAERTLGPGFPRKVLLGFGVASLLLAAFSLLAQRDVKRMFAYSSVEHMGVLAIGASFAAPIALVGVLLHVLSHAAAKATAFFGAGSVLRKYATKDLARVKGAVGLLPLSGPMLVLAVLALSALPPFGIFRSELLIVAGGLSSGGDVAGAVLIVLVTVAFLGITWISVHAMLTPSPAPEPAHLPGALPRALPGTPPGTLPGAPPGALPHTPAGAPVRGETSRWIVLSMAVGLVALVILGVHVPGDLSQLLTRAAAELRVPR